MKSLRDVATSALSRWIPAPGELGAHDFERLRDAMAECVEGRGGEVATRSRAARLAARYATLTPAGKRTFLSTIADFAYDQSAVDDALERFRNAEESGHAHAAHALREALTPGRIALLRAFNTPPDGVKFLVDLRADLLAMRPVEPNLRALETDLKDLLASWFDVGFLELHQITWDAPASLLERLAGYEAVHQMRGWADLKHRLQADRRCFAFLHPAMPNEPLIFVEVALVDQMAGEIGPLLDTKIPLGDATHPSHAIFYSISNCQRGLAGISFGNALIKRVVKRLSEEFRSLRTFATLSPLPGFRTWLDRQAPADDPNDPTALRRVLVQRAWYRDQTLTETLKQPLVRLATHYLLNARRDNGQALDPVAHFHLTNGARIERINWLADTSAKGLREAAGIMVNYLYQLDRIDANAEAYARDGTIDASAGVHGLLERPRGRAARLEFERVGKKLV